MPIIYKELKHGYKSTREKERIWEPEVRARRSDLGGQKDARFGSPGRLVGRMHDLFWQPGQAESDRVGAIHSSFPRILLYYI